MDKGRFLIETHLRTGRPIAESSSTISGSFCGRGRCRPQDATGSG
jgi:hypothetical protein